MYFPNLKLPIADVIQYINDENFKELIFQFNLSNAYCSQLGALVCYAMNTYGQNMNEEPIVLEKSFESSDLSFPINLGNLVIYFNNVEDLKNQLTGKDLSDYDLIFSPVKGLYNYIGYDVSVSDKTKLVIQGIFVVNPCPPRCSFEESSQSQTSRY